MYAGKKKKYFHDSDPSKFFTNIASCWEKYDEIEKRKVRTKLKCV